MASLNLVRCSPYCMGLVKSRCFFQNANLNIVGGNFLSNIISTYEGGRGEGGGGRERDSDPLIYIFCFNPWSFSYSLSLPPPLLVFFLVVICSVLFCAMISPPGERMIGRICFLLAIMYNAGLFLYARACRMMRGSLFSRFFLKQCPASHFQGMLSLPMSLASKPAGNTDRHRGAAILEITYKLSK